MLWSPVAHLAIRNLRMKNKQPKCNEHNVSVLRSKIDAIHHRKLFGWDGAFIAAGRLAPRTAGRRTAAGSIQPGAPATLVSGLPWFRLRGKASQSTVGARRSVERGSKRWVMENVRLSRNTTIAKYRRMCASQDRLGLARFLRERFRERYFTPLESVTIPHGSFYNGH